MVLAAKSWNATRDRISEAYNDEIVEGQLLPALRVDYL